MLKVDNIVTLSVLLSEPSWDPKELQNIAILRDHLVCLKGVPILGTTVAESPRMNQKISRGSRCSPTSCKSKKYERETGIARIGKDRHSSKIII